MRFLGFIFLGLTVLSVIFDYLALGPDATGFVLRPLEVLWQQVHSNSLQSLQSSLEQYVPVGVWDVVVRPILTAPAALVFGAVFLIFYLLSGVRNRSRPADTIELL